MRSKKKFTLLISMTLVAAFATVGAVLWTNGNKLNYMLADGDTYKVSIDRTFMASKVAEGSAVGSFNYTTKDGNNIGFSSNWWAFPISSTGGALENGGHYDAEIHNTTAITGIKRVNIHAWFIDWYTHATEFRVYTSHSADFSTDTRVYYPQRGEGSARSLGEDFVIETPDEPSYVKIMPQNSIASELVIFSFSVDYGCAKPDNKMLDRAVRDGKKCYATSLDGGNGWSNMKASYVFFGVSDNYAIVSANINLIDSDYRAYSGLVLTDGSKLDGSKGYETPRNYKSFQLGLAKKGFWSACDLNGTRGRDSSNPTYYPTTDVGTEGKMTIVLKGNVIYTYINDTYINSKTLTNVDPCGGFPSGAKYMFGAFFQNYQSTSRTVTLVDEIYGQDAVATEIATNDVYANLR